MGSATSEAAFEAGFKDVQNGGADARDLAQVIILAAQKADIKNIVHPCGEDVARDLGDLLSAQKINVQRAVLYKAELATTFPADVLSAIKNGQITTITLFSARAAKRFSEILIKEKMTDLPKQLELVCLSERIAAEVALYPWRSVKVSLLQNQESLMDCLRARSQDESRRQVMASDVVLRAFGGIRPLSNRLGITPSTVQGWKERGTIPETRINDILAAALKNGIDLDTLWGRNAPEKINIIQSVPPGFVSRRSGKDRRQTPSVTDDLGHIRSTSYQGPDRRSGLDRRAYQQRQQQRMQQEKWRFLNRSVIMGAFFFIAVSYAVVVLMAPELLRGKNPLSAVQEQVNQVLKVEQPLPVTLQPGVIQANASDQPPSSWAGEVNSGIEKIEHMTDSTTEAIQELATVQGIEGMQSLVQVLSRAGSIPTTSEGNAAFADMMQQLKRSLAAAPQSSIARQAQIQAARGQNKDLDRVLQGVSGQDLEAAAILLMMNEFRGNVVTGRPFAEDLRLIKNMAGDNVELQQSIDRLAPAAEKGVLSRPALQKEFKGLAADIVVAKLKGEEAGTQQKILERLSKLVKVRKVDNIEGQETDAVVARAQLLLDQGNIDGAMAELSTLKGAPADVAAPWMENARQAQEAESLSNTLLQGVLSQHTSASGANLGAAFSGLLRQLMPRQNVIYLSPSMQK